MTRLTLIAAGIAAAAMSLVAAGPAAAALVVASYSGVITRGYDTTGEFGSPNTDLNGQAFLAQFKFDPVLAPFRQSNAQQDYVQGGTTTYFPGKVFIDATVTVAGVTQHFDSTGYGVGSTGTGGAIYHAAQTWLDTPTVFDNGYLSAAANVPPPGPAALDTPFTGIQAPTPYYTTMFRVYYGDRSTGVVHDAYGWTTGAITYTVALASDVPEPSIWALMLIGIGGLGAAVRTARRGIKGRIA